MTSCCLLVLNIPSGLNHASVVRWVNYLSPFIPSFLPCLIFLWTCTLFYFNADKQGKTSGVCWISYTWGCYSSSFFWWKVSKWICFENSAPQRLCWNGGKISNPTPPHQCCCNYILFSFFSWVWRLNFVLFLLKQSYHNFQLCFENLIIFTVYDNLLRHDNCGYCLINFFCFPWKTTF